MIKESKNLNKAAKCKSCGAKYAVTSNLANFCSHCCALLPNTKKFVDEYFHRIGLSNKLDESKRLFLKNEYVAAARVATIVLENEARKMINDDSLFGVSLMSKAFSFEYDDKNKKIKRQPLIKLNKLDTLSERSEQEGMRIYCMGIMSGMRNILAHSTPHIIPFRCLILISDIHFILREITSGSSIKY